VTAAQHEHDDEVYDDTPLEFTTAGRRKIEARDRVHFKIDGEPFTMIRPKLAVATTAVQLIDAEADRPTLELSADLLRCVSGLFRYIEAAPRTKPTESHPAGRVQGRALLDARLSDPEDSFDLVDLMPVFKSVLEGMFDRPTGARPASSAKPRRTGSGSGAGTRKRPAKTSGR
jgi:hypothetical protein